MSDCILAKMFPYRFNKINLTLNSMIKFITRRTLEVVLKRLFTLQVRKWGLEEFRHPGKVTPLS